MTLTPHDVIATVLSGLHGNDSALTFSQRAEVLIGELARHGYVVPANVPAGVVRLTRQEMSDIVDALKTGRTIDEDKRARWVALAHRFKAGAVADDPAAKGEG